MWVDSCRKTPENQTEHGRSVSTRRLRIFPDQFRSFPFEVRTFVSEFSSRKHRPGLSNISFNFSLSPACIDINRTIKPKISRPRYTTIHHYHVTCFLSFSSPDICCVLQAYQFHIISSFFSRHQHELHSLSLISSCSVHYQE